MKDNVIEVNKLYKEYQLGIIGRGTLYRDLQSLYAKIMNKPDPNSIIGMEDYEKSKKNILALNDINLTIKNGEKIGLIGHNGAGKSTFLKILSRITAPSKGEVKILGRTASLLEVGTGFHPELTGRENIYLNGSINGLKINEIDKKIDKIIEFSQIEKFIDTPVKRYSTGMFVKLGFSVAAFLDPDILIVDEVLAVGDAAFRERAINKMSEISKSKNSTLVFVSHNMQSIRELCDRVLIFKNGLITFDGPTDKAVNEYITSSLSDIESKNKLSTNYRKGGENFKFTSIEFKDEHGTNITEIISGKKLIIKLKYESKIFIDKLSFLIDIRIKDLSGYEVSSLSSQEMGTVFSEFQNTGEIKIIINKLLLRGGTYILDIYSSLRHGKRLVLDNLLNAVKIKIEPSDFFNSGHNLSTNSIMILESQITNNS